MAGSKAERGKEKNSIKENPGRVLVADDEPGMLYVLGRVLRREGFEVDTTTCFADALDQLAKHTYDLLITDVHMPGGTGIELLGRCRREHPDVAVILMTGKPVLSDAVQTVRSGAYDYLAKPVSPDALRKSVADALEQREKKRASLSQTVALSSADRMDLRIVRTIGTGTMGIVFLAEKGGEQYALKVFQSWKSELESGKMLERFAREAEILAKINHPNIVRVYDYRAAAGLGPPCILMEYIDGEDLECIVNALSVDLDSRLLLICQVARALSIIHEHGIIHRDIKPSNVLVTRENVAKLTDFGIAHIADSTLTRTGDMLGSVAYMAPELFSGKPVDCRADVFSLGVLSYELITGQRPFNGASLPEIAKAICIDQPVPPNRLVPDLPEMISDLLLTMLKKPPEARCHSSAEIARKLEQVCGSVLETR